MKIRVISITILMTLLFLTACSGAAAPTPAPEPSIANTETVAEPTITPETVAYEEVTLTINSSNQTSYGPIFIAEAEGYFAEYGIKLNYITFKKSNEAVPLLITGDLDIYAGTINAGILNVLGQEDNIKVVADRGHIAPGDSCTYLGLLVRKDLYDSGAITGAAGLAGQAIESTAAGTAGYLLSTYLAQAGLTFDDVVLNDIPSAEFVDAFTNKALAAISTAEPNLTRVLTSGNAVLLAKAQDVIGTTQLSILAFGKNIIVDHPDFGARFLAAYLKGIQQYNQGKTTRNLQIMADATGETIETMQAACWVPINIDGSIDFSGIEGFQQWSVAQGQLDSPITEDQFWDPKFLTAAQALLKP